MNDDSERNRHVSGDEPADVALAAGPTDSVRGFAPGLSWTHYRTLTKVEHRAERLFYEIEADRQNWSVPHLERQIDSLLFARLLKSREEAGLLELATRGQVAQGPGSRANSGVA